MAKYINDNVYLFNGEIFIINDWIPENEHQYCIDNRDNATIISADGEIQDAFVIFGKIITIFNYNVYYVEITDDCAKWHLLISDIIHYVHICNNEFDEIYIELNLLVVVKDEKKYIYGIYEYKPFTNVYPDFTLLPEFIANSPRCNVNFPTKRIKSAIS